MIVENWFPTYIGFEVKEDHKKISSKLTPVCKKIQKQTSNAKNEWVSKLYQTCHTHDICKDKKFDIINNYIYKKVEEYIKTISSKQKIIYREGWFNVYKKNDFQEFHCHPSRHLSVIYILNSNSAHPNIIFEKDGGMYNTDSDIISTALFPKVNYKSTQGSLMIFRSSLNHCVERKENNGERISLAYNFNLSR
tara:strand:- start:3281 stop:3859 length:579 start_codon:yes stop_codon:yes gene_type:complete